MQIKFNETGRSMVEMLGVLAIIGVLSVAGVGAYQYALTAYQAGKVQDVLGKAKTLAQTDSRASHALEVNRFVKSALPEYTPDDKKSMVKLVDGKYQVTTFKVVYKVCEKILQKENILNDMGISVLTKTCGNTNSKTNMVFSFNATPTVETGSHFGGGSSGEKNESDSSDMPDINPPDNPPNIPIPKPDVTRCPDKKVWREIINADGTSGGYGCVCRHEYEFGDNCERCYPPKEWIADEAVCRCPDTAPIWHNGECVECMTDDDCPDYYYCGNNNFCQALDCDEMGFPIRGFYCGYFRFKSDEYFNQIVKVDQRYSSGDGRVTYLLNCQDSLLIIPKDFSGKLYLNEAENFDSLRYVIDGIEYKPDEVSYTFNLKKGIHRMSIKSTYDHGDAKFQIGIHKLFGGDICMAKADSCVAGYYCPVNQLTPVICPEGHYCPADSFLGPTPCPTGTTSVEGATAEADCK